RAATSRSKSSISRPSLVPEEERLAGGHRQKQPGPALEEGIDSHLRVLVPAPRVVVEQDDRARQNPVEQRLEGRRRRNGGVQIDVQPRNVGRNAARGERFGDESLHEHSVAIKGSEVLLRVLDREVRVAAGGGRFRLEQV